MPKRTNPLRRTSDRVEWWLCGVLVILLAVGLPAVSVAVGLATYTSQMRTVRAQSADRHTVTAYVTGAARTAGDTAVVKERAPVRWTDPDGTRHTGTAAVDHGTPTGAGVRIWVDRDGSVASAPLTPGKAIGSGWSAGILAAGSVVAVLYAGRKGVERAINRRRYAQWADEWEQLEPRWSGRGA
jgi:hypothetical protein